MQYFHFNNWWKQNRPGQDVPDFEEWKSGAFGSQTTQGGTGGGVAVDLGEGLNAGGGVGGHGFIDPNTGRFVPIRGPFDQNRLRGDLRWLAVALGLPMDLDNATFDEDFRGNILNALSGPLFQGEALHLPGEPTGVSFALNMLLGEFLKQQGRSTEAETLLRGNVENIAGGPAAALNRQALAQAGDLRSDRNALFKRLEDDLRAQTAAQLNSTDNRLRDLGITGLGAAGRGAALQAQNIGLSNLQRGLTDLRVAQLGQRRDDLAAQLGAAQQGAATQLSLEQNPVLALISSLQGPQNQAVGDLINALLQTGNLQIGKALENRGGSFFEEGGGQIIGNLIGAAATLGSGGFGAPAAATAALGGG